MKKIILALMMAAGVFLFACNIGINKSDESERELIGSGAFNMKIFDAQRKAWKAKNIHAYRCTIQFGLDFPVTVTVAPNIETGSAYKWLNIDAIFAKIKDEAPNCLDLGYSVTIKYNDKYFFPEKYTVITYDNNILVDDYEITDFEVITDGGAGSDFLEYPDKFNTAVLDTQKASWKAMNIQAYRYTVREYMDIPTMSATVTITPDSEPVVVYDEVKLSEDFLFPIFLIKGVTTIDAIFDMVKASGPPTLNENYIVLVYYNKEYHFPEEYIVMCGDLIGAGYRLKITNFEAIPE